MLKIECYGWTDIEILPLTISITTPFKPLKDKELLMLEFLPLWVSPPKLKFKLNTLKEMKNS
jgi:hypothetical protein